MTSHPTTVEGVTASAPMSAPDVTASDDPQFTIAVRDLSREECLAALRAHTLGRLAVSQGALPLILPVNYAMEGADIVFRTREGGLLDRTCRKTIVAFEIDDYDVATRTGWSVLVVGVANVLYGGDWLRAVELGLTSAGAGDGELFVKIVPGNVTGRAIDTTAVVSAGGDHHHGS